MKGNAIVYVIEGGKRAELNGIKGLSSKKSVENIVEIETTNAKNNKCTTVENNIRFGIHLMELAFPTIWMYNVLDEITFTIIVSIRKSVWYTLETSQTSLLRRI